MLNFSGIGSTSLSLRPNVVTSSNLNISFTEVDTLSEAGTISALNLTFISR